MKRLLIATVCTLSIHAWAGQPNILFLFADDMSYEAMSALGSEVQTPNLDRLKMRGVSFTHAYNMGGWNGAVCVASRAMLNSGRFIWRAGDFMEHAAKSGETPAKLWAQFLSEAGYDTYMSGKWHVNVAPESAFDHVVNKRPGMPNQTAAGYFRPDPANSWTPWDPQFGGFWKGGTHWSEVLGNDSIGFIEQAARSEKPFFMYLAFNAPHDPRQSPKNYVDKYPLETVRVPKDFLPEYPYKQEMGCYRTNKKGDPAYLRDEKLAPWPRTVAAVKLHRQEYFAIITHMDDQIGRILDALEQSGRADNTVIIFSADHGLACGHHGLLGKQNMYEHSLRVPLILAGPGFESGRQIDVPVYYQDIMPTSLELAGAAIPEATEFRSLLPLVKGERSEQYDAIYGCMWPDRQRAVIRDHWKLIYYPKVPVYRLYDLKNDPDEMNDLADDSGQAEKLAEMKRALQELMHEMDDPMLKESR